MKTAILTFSSAENYGAQLQAFGLQYALRKIGIDSYHVHAEKIAKSKKLKHKIKEILSLKKKCCYKKFQKDNLKFCSGNYNATSIDKLNNHFNAFVSGSDQVFNMNNGVDRIWFQEFVRPGHLKISYAASMGIKEVPEQYRDRVRQALDGFDTLSLREQDAVDELGKYTKNNICRMIDPVFLPDYDEWNKICIDPKESSPYIFVYGTQMTDKIRNIATELHKQTGYKIYSIFPMKGARVLDWKIGPAEFVGYIKNASYIVTSSFHCTAFSMIYEKNLIEVLHSTTGSRAKGLLELMDKTECIYSDYNFDLLQEIDYTGTQNKILDERRRAFEFLKQAFHVN